MLLDAKSYYTDDALKIYSIVHEQIERQSSGSYVVNDNLAARNIAKKLKRCTEDEKQFLNELMKDRIKTLNERSKDKYEAELIYEDYEATNMIINATESTIKVDVQNTLFN